MIGQRKPRRKPHESNSDCHEGAVQRLTLSGHSCLATHHTVLFSLLINTSVTSLLSVFVEILFLKAEGPGLLSLTIGLVATDSI